MLYALELLIRFIYLISIILINKNHDILYDKDEIGVLLSLLNLSYKLFVEKHVSDFVRPIIPPFDESSLVVSENVLDVPPMYEHVRSHILKVSRQESKALHEIIATSTTRKGVIESLNQTLNPNVARTSSSQVIV